MWMVRVVIAPVLIAAVFVIVLAPVNSFFSRKLGKRASFAPLITTVLTFIVILGPATLIGVLTVQQLKAVQASGLMSSLQAMTNGLIRWTQKSGKILSVFGVDMSYGSLRETLDEATQWVLTKLGAFAAEVAANVPDLTIGVLLFVIAFYFWLRDGGSLLLWLEDVLPFPERESKRLFSALNNAAKGVVIGQLFTGAVQAGLTLIALFALSVPGAFLWGIFAFFLSFIPLFGTAPVTLGATIYLFAVGRPGSAVIMLVAVVVIGASDNVVRPLAQSSNGDMHPLLALIGIFGGLATLGAAGIFLGPLVAALALWAIEMQGRNKASPVE